MTPPDWIQVGVTAAGLTLVLQRTDALVTFIPWWRKYRNIENLAESIKATRPAAGKLLCCPPCLAAWLIGPAALVVQAPIDADLVTAYALAAIIGLAVSCRRK